MSLQDDLRQKITDRIIEALETCQKPWERPWASINAGFPKNVVSKKSYRGINIIALALEEFSSQWWGTFNQWKELGLKVKKGSKSSQIIYFNFNEFTQEDGTVKKIPFLRYSNVFNAEAVEGEGIEKYLPQAGEERDFTDCEEAERVVKATGAKVVHQGGVAKYSIAADTITMPAKRTFRSETGYYGTLLHELTHWTGADQRLARLEKAARFGSNSYAFEELVAEIGSCFLCAEVSIDNKEQLENHASYLKSWLEILKADNNAIIKAASLASQASDFVLGRKPEKNESEENAK